MYVVCVCVYECVRFAVACLVPVLFNLKGPVPLQVYMLVVIREDRADRVRAAGECSGGRLLGGRQIELNFLLRGIGADHVLHFINYRMKQNDSISQLFTLLNDS